MFPVFSWIRKQAAHLGRLSFAALGAVALTACVAGPGPGGGKGGTVQVALLVPSGSGQATDEFLALSLQNAAQLAISDLSGVKIDLRVYPTAGIPAQAGAMAKKAVTEGADVILGPVFAGEANAAGVAVAGSGINVLSFSNNADIAGGPVFILGPTFENTANRLAAYARSKGLARIMIVHDQNPAGQVGKAAIQGAVTRAGAQVAAVGSYEFSQNGIVEAASGLAQKARESQAQAIFFTADTSGALPLITQLLKDNRVDPAVTRFIGLTRWDIPAATLALPGVQGGWFALPDPGLYDQFKGRYTSAYGSEPHPAASLAYDGIAAIGALASKGGASSLTAAGLTQGAGFAGVNGVFRFRADGSNERGLAVAQILNNQLTVIDPAPRSFGGFGL